MNNLSHETESIWSWITRIAVVGIVMVLFGGFALMFLPRIREQQKAEQELTTLKKEEASLTWKRDQLLEKKVQTEESADYTEFLSRDRLEMKRAGETIFRFGKTGN